MRFGVKAVKSVTGVEVIASTKEIDLLPVSDDGMPVPLVRPIVGLWRVYIRLW